MLFSIDVLKCAIPNELAAEYELKKSSSTIVWEMVERKTYLFVPLSWSKKGSSQEFRNASAFLELGWGRSIIIRF